MNMLKNFTLALLFGPAMVASSLADTGVTMEITNNTSRTLNMVNMVTDPAPPADFSLSGYDVSPQSIRNIHFVNKRTYTYPSSDWQPSLRKVKPIELLLSYQMDGADFGCQVQTRFEAPIGFGVLEPRYRPDWKTRTAYTGNGEYTCRSEIAQKMLEPPFSYTVRLIVE